MSKDIFDFGFTAVNEDELEVVQQASAVSDKAERLYKAMQPLLDNLLLNPEKEYIHWPDREEKVIAFRKHLKAIYED